MTEGSTARGAVDTDRWRDDPAAGDPHQMFGTPLDPVVFWALTGASFGTSFLTAAFGIGGGLALLAILASLLPPAALVPVHGLVQLGSNAGRAMVLRSHINRSLLAAFAVGSVLGALLGGAIATSLPASAVQIGVGLFVLWSIFFKPPAFIQNFASVAGFVSSLLSMFFGATGPMAASFVKSTTDDRLEYSSTHAALMTLQHGLKCVVFGLFGFAFGPWMPLVIAMIATGFLGTLVGKRVLTALTNASFGKVLNAILLVLALRLIWQGLAASGLF